MFLTADNKKITEDTFSLYFTSPEYDSLKAAQTTLESQSAWHTASELKVLPMDTPMEANMFFNSGNNIPLEILIDTVENAGIMLDADGEVACLRACALPSLLATAGISGGGVSRVSKVALATGLTAFLTGARKQSQILTRAGKVAAVVSDHYQQMEISDLLAVVDTLSSQFGKAEFDGGYVSHALTVAQFKYPDAAKDATAAYVKALNTAGRVNSGVWTPVIQFRASDTSNEAAKLIVFLKNGRCLLPISGVSVAHVSPSRIDPTTGLRQTSLDKFAEEADLVFSKMLLQIEEVVPKMLATEIRNPGNAFIGLCKYANIPQKWGGVVEREIRDDYPDGSDCTFLDLYEALTSVTALAIKDGLTVSSKKMLDMEEGISKVANNRASWTRFDLPGTVGWSVVRY